MKRLAMLCLAFIVGPLALAQQPSEWRPNISEDNKAATWEDTSAFMINMLTGSGANYVKQWNGKALYVNFDDQFSTPKRCSLSVRGFYFVSTNSASHSQLWTIDLAKVDPLSIRVNQNSALGYWAVSMTGTNAGAFCSTVQGAQRDHVAVDDVLGHVKPLLLETACTASDRYCHPMDAEEGRVSQEQFADQESAKRYARALMNAALMCGGTKAVSPF